jgi:hypothetical protein
MPAAQRPPNVIVILADDLGINDVTTNGGGYAAQGVPTPNIDAIARDGVRFDQGYAAAGGVHRVACGPAHRALSVALWGGVHPDTRCDGAWSPVLSMPTRNACIR